MEGNVLSPLPHVPTITKYPFSPPDIKNTTSMVYCKSLEYFDMAQNQFNCPFSFAITVTICVIQYVNDL